MNRKRPFIFLLAVLVLGVAVVFLDSNSSSPAQDPALAQMPAPEQVEHSPAGSTASVEPGPELERELVVTQQGQPSHEEATTAEEQESQLLFRGRVVAKETGQPLAGVKVHFFAFLEDDYARKSGTKSPGQILFETQADGIFDFQYPQIPISQMLLSFKAPGRVQLQGRWGGFQIDRNEFDFGDLMMQAGMNVHGVVRTEAGRPLPRFRLKVDGVKQDVNGFATGIIGTNSEEGGVFQFDSALPAGRWQLSGNVNGYFLVSPKEIEVPAVGEMAPLNVVVKEMPFIAGVVVDDQGAGISGVRVVTLDRDSGYTESAKTDEGGRFKLFARHNSFPPMRLKLSGAGVLPRETEFAYEWGKHDLVLPMDSALSFTLQVKLKGSGTPVEDYRLFCSVDGLVSPHKSEFHPLGETIVDGLKHGDAVLTIVPHDPSLASVNSMPLQIRPNMETVVVELTHMQALPVRVIDANGAAMERAFVQTLQSPPPKRNFPLNEFHRRKTRYQAYSNSPLVYSQTLTDSKGKADLYVPSSAEHPVVRVEGDFPTLVQELQWPATGEELVLTVAAAGSIRGVLLAPGRPHGSVGLDFSNNNLLFRTGRGFAQIQEENVIAPALDGSFLVANVKPGNYTARLALAPTSAEVAAGTSAWWIHPVSLQEFEVRSGEETVLNLDATSHALGSLRVHASLDGEPASGRKIVFEWRNAAGHGRRLAATLDAFGSLLFEDLPTGEYQALLQVDGGWVQCRTKATVVAGQETELVFQGEQISITLKLIDESGLRLPQGTRVQVDPIWDTEFKVGAEGTIILNPAPLRIRGVYAQVGDTPLFSEQVSLLDVEENTVVTVVMTTSFPMFD